MSHGSSHLISSGSVGCYKSTSLSRVEFVRSSRSNCSCSSSRSRIDQSKSREEGGARQSACWSIFGSKWRPASLCRTRFRRSGGSSSRQRKHDPRLRLQWSDRPRCQGLPGYRFDRPGFGHSERPRGVMWTPNAQADLISVALVQLGVSDAVVLGHSWGASVAVALALKYPNMVRGLVLASGYYYPTTRPDVVAMGAPALPIVGDILSHTISPLLSRVIWPFMLKKIFGPRSVPEEILSISEGNGATAMSNTCISR